MVEQVDIDKTKAAYSWTDGDTLFFMTNDTFEELPVPVSLVDNHAFLVEGEEFRVMMCEGKILGVELPTVMQYTVCCRRRVIILH
jgi:elongation factor P